MMELIGIYLAISGVIGFLLFMRWINGGWVQAIIASVLAPMIGVSLGFVTSIGLMWGGHIAAEIFTPRNFNAMPYIEAFSFWGSVAVVVFLFSLYCIQARHGSELKTGPALGGGAGFSRRGSAKGAWRNESVGVFRRRF